jgi:O-antigen/teichoic acid export membrane protein
MLYDPITKAFLSKFGGLSMVGYYEMANKMVQQFRSLIISANQVLVPAIADLQENNPERIRSIYLTNYNLLFFLALPLYTLIIISTPFISEIWIGHYEKVFINIGIFLAIGNFLNTLAGPAYFSNLGIGSLKWNVIGHIAIAVLNIIFSAFLGFLFGGYGVVIGWALALSLGSAVIYISYHIDNKIPVSELFPKDSRGIFIVCFIVLVLSLIMQSSIIFYIRSILLNIVVILFSTLIIFIPLWFHPMRNRIIGWSKELIRSKMV